MAIRAKKDKVCRESLVYLKTSTVYDSCYR